MSFLSIVKNIGKVLLKGAEIAEPFAIELIPGAQQFDGAIKLGLATAEHAIQAANAGEKKLPLALETANGAFTTLQGILQGFNKTLDIPQDKLTAAMNAGVAYYNMLNELVKNAQIKDLPPS